MEVVVSFLSQAEDDWDDQQYKKIFNCTLNEVIYNMKYYYKFFECCFIIIIIIIIDE